MSWSRAALSSHSRDRSSSLKLGAQRIEELEGEPGHLVGVARLLVVAGAQFEGFVAQRVHASSSRIAAVRTP